MPISVCLMTGEIAACLEAEVGSAEGFERDLEISIHEGQILKFL